MAISTILESQCFKSCGKYSSQFHSHLLFLDLPFQWAHIPSLLRKGSVFFGCILHWRISLWRLRRRVTIHGNFRNGWARWWWFVWWQRVWPYTIVGARLSQTHFLEPVQRCNQRRIFSRLIKLNFVQMLEFE